MQNRLLKLFQSIYRQVADTIVDEYHRKTINNSYSCRLVGEKPTKNKNETIVLYRIVGKRDILEASVMQLLENHSLLARFHPIEAVKLGAIAMGDALLGTVEEDRKNLFERIKDKMLKPFTS